MYTSLVLIALAATSASPSPKSEPVNWLDYGTAYRAGNREHRPLAVFIGNGVEGWKDLSKEGRLSPEVRALLREHYLPVYVNTSKPAGRELAASFELKDGPALVLSDHTGDVQAYRHQGALSDGELAQTLRQHAEPEASVGQTAAPAPADVRYYYQPAPVLAPPVIPFGGFGGFGGFSGGRGGC